MSTRFRAFARKRLTLIVALTLGVPLLLVVLAIGLIVAIDLRPLLEHHASTTLDRRLSIGAFRIGWGNPLLVEAVDLKLANAAWGSSADMVRIERISAEIDLFSVFGGDFGLRNIDVVKPEIVLERDTDGTGNWRFGGSVSAAPHPPPMGPKATAAIPLTTKARLRDGSLTFRTSSGAILRFDVRDLNFDSAGKEQPRTLVVDGAYNGTPVKLTARSPSSRDLHTRSGPTDVAFSASTPTAEVSFAGTMLDPLDFEGVQGSMQVSTSDLVDLLNVFGAGIPPSASDGPAAIPLVLAGTFSRSGDRWQLAEAKGRLLKDDFAGEFSLTEAGRGEPDQIGIAAAFPRLDLRPLLAHPQSEPKRRRNPDSLAEYRALSLKSVENRGTNFALQIAADVLALDRIQLTEFSVRARLASRDDAIERLTFTFAGGAFDASVSVLGVDEGSRVSVKAGFTAADTAQIARMFGAASGQIAGKLSGRIALEMAGGNVQEALKASSAQFVLAMTEGRIARRLLEMASTDLRSVFRRDERLVRISCLLGVLDMKNGLGSLSPLKLRTPVTTLIGGGQVDFLREQLDITVKSMASSTGFFALDIPLRIAGSFSKPSIDPMIGSSARWLDASAGSGPAHRLPSDLRHLVDGNSCSR